MAESKKLSYSQIAEPNLLEPLKKELQEVNKLLGVTAENLKGVIDEAAKLTKQTPLTSFENLEKVEKGLGDAKKAVEELDKVEKDRLKLDARIKELDDERIKTNFDLREQIRLQTKALKENSTENVRALNNYEKLVKQQKEAEKELLRLTASFGKNSKIVAESKQKYTALSDEIKEINKVREKEKKEISEVEKLQRKLKDLKGDSIKEEIELKEQIRLQTKALRDNAKATNSTSKFYDKLKKDTNAAQLELKELTAQFGKNSKQAKTAKKVFDEFDEKLRDINESARDGRRDVGRYEKGVKGLTKTFKIFASATIILKVLELLKTSVSQNSDGAAELEKIWVRVTAAFSVVARRLIGIFPAIQAKFERFFISMEIRLAKLTGLFSDNGDEVAELEKQYADLAEVADKDLTKVFDGLGAEVEDLIKKKIELIDTTLAYRRHIVGLEQDIAALIPTQEKLRAEFEDDSTSLETQIEAGVAFRGALIETQRIREEIAAKNLKLAQDNAKANRVSVEAQEELSAATLEYNQLIADQASELVSTEKEIQKLRDDTTQLNLDFYVDDFDNRKTINERIIADETQTFARRRELLNQNQKEAEEVNNLRGEALNIALRERGKAELDFEELRKKQSSEEIARIIRESGISEPLAIRALEIIRERRVELQDNAEAQRDLNAAEAESRLLQDDIALQLQALMSIQKEGIDLEMILQELSEARLKSEIENLGERIGVAEEGSQEFIALNQELNDKLLEQNQQRLEKDKARLQEFGKAASEGFSLLSDLADGFFEKRLTSIDAEIGAEEKRIDRLKALAAEGNEDAENNLAITEQRQAQLELEREQQLKRQKQSELVLTAIQTYGSKVSANDPSPLASTIADVTVLRAFINTLPGFYEGTENTGNVGALKDNQGSITGFTHENERVIKAEQNRLIGSMSNAELTMLAHRENTKTRQIDNSSFVVRELQDLKRITKEKPVYLGSDFDKITGAVIRRIKTGNKLERIHQKKGGVWG